MLNYTFVVKFKISKKCRVRQNGYKTWAALYQVH